MVTIAEHQKHMKRYNQRRRIGTSFLAPGPKETRATVSVTMSSLRKALCGSAAPTYEAHYADGTARRFTLFQLPDRPLDFERGRTIARRMQPDKELTGGFIEHDLPGKPWIRMADDMGRHAPTKTRQVRDRAPSVESQAFSTV